MSNPPVSLPEDKDYRFAIAVALVALMAILFGLVMYFTKDVQLAILAGITPFIGLLQQIIVAYFNTKE
jgi:hypothetical protein